MVSVCVLGAVDQMQSITSIIPCLGLVSPLALAFSVRLHVTSKLCQYALDCSQSGGMVFLSLWAQVEGGDHGAWPHPNSISPAISIGTGIPYCPEPLCGITWCYEIFCLFPLWKETRTACLGFLQWYLPNPINF